MKIKNVDAYYVCANVPTHSVPTYYIGIDKNNRKK